MYAVLRFLQASFKKIETCKKKRTNSKCPAGWIIKVSLSYNSHSDQEIKRYGHHRCPLMDSPNRHFLFSKHLNHSFDWVFCFSVIFFTLNVNGATQCAFHFVRILVHQYHLRFIHVAWSSNLLIVIVLS